MVLSRGLMISLSISALGCTLLFLYFRNKISSMEKKVDVMFDLIQNHQQEQYNTQGTNHQEVEEHNIMSNDNFNNFDENIQNNVNLISVSEDDDDSDEVSDSEDDVSDNEELPKISLDSTENMTLEVNDIKKITVQEADKVLIDDSIQMEEVEDITDSLDEMDDDSDDEENNNEDVTEVKEVTVQKIDDDFDYSKLKVTELKALAKQKGLENYKSLKKGPLVDLLKSTE